jgi:hypothetical protein
LDLGKLARPVFQGRDDVAFTKATALMALAALEAVMDELRL